MRLIQRFLADERGATSIEYVTIAGLISIVIIGAITSIGGNLSTMYIGPIGNAMR